MTGAVSIVGRYLRDKDVIASWVSTLSKNVRQLFRDPWGEAGAI